MSGEEAGDVLDGDDEEWDPVQWARQRRITTAGAAVEGVDDGADADESGWLADPVGFDLTSVEAATLTPPVLPDRELERLRDSLVVHEPPLYRRDRRGVWRYDWGPRVPGARDATPSRLVRPVVDGSRLWLPRLLVTVWFEPFVDACTAVSDLSPWLVCHSESFAAVASAPVGVVAAELCPWAMCDMQAVADVLGIQRATMASYRARGLAPEPQVWVGRTPLWSWPVVMWWRQLTSGPPPR